MRLPEFMVLLTIGAFWLVPLAAGVWALVTLQRIRSAQDAMSRQIEALVRQLQRGTAQ